MAFASTAHKIQGATIPKPQKVIINVEDTFDAAMVYVMLSRVCSLEQILLLNEFPENKMYPNQQVLVELKRLDKKSMNLNPSRGENIDTDAMKISSLNCRSIKKHYQDILNDNSLIKSDLIALQETWLNNDDDSEDLHIPGYELSINSKGKGKGIATYYRRDTFEHVADIKKTNMQLSKFSSAIVDIIVLYRSQQGSIQEMKQFIKQLEDVNVPTLIIGDFNFPFLEQGPNLTKQVFNKNKYSQLIREPTHIEGNTLDHAYIRDEMGLLEITAETHTKYYTDHRGIAVIIKPGMSILL